LIIFFHFEAVCEEQVLQQSKRTSFFLHICMYFIVITMRRYAIQRITAVINVETNIIVSIAVGLIERAGILVIMYVETFKTDIIVSNGNVIMC